MNQKLENLLQLALQTTEETRIQTEELNVGFDTSTQSWELIVKYHGSLEALEALNIQVEYLIAGYALLKVPENLVETMASLEEIEYVEKPKRYFYDATNPPEDSCVAQLPRGDLSLTGRGVLIAILDSGINYTLPVFRREDGSTRIRYLWDQTLTSGPPPSGFRLGTEFDGEQINTALNAETPQQRFELLPTVDSSGHGTAVAGIAAGFHSGGYRGLAPESELLIAKLGLPEAGSFPRTTEIMRAVTWAVRKGLELQMPVAVNLSFGNSYGAHDGSSLLERFLDNAAEIGRTVICVGSGNDGASAGHLAGELGDGQSVGPGRSGTGNRADLSVGRGESVIGNRVGRGRPAAEVELAVAEYESSLSIQLWKNYSDVYRIRLSSPGGQETELPMTVEGGKYTLRLEQTEILVYFGEPTPYASTQEIYLELIPTDRSYINSGIWKVYMEAVRLVTGRYYFYLPSAAIRSTGTGFFTPTPELTLTIPSTAAKVITVGAYDSTYDAYADFSGRGLEVTDRTVGVVTGGITKPDIVAPGVAVLAPDIYGGLLPFTGTSFAAPIATGSSALLMEWGIVRGNDPFLYGEKVKAYLRKGAQPLRGIEQYPNAKVGFGKLCVSESLPIN